MWLISYMNTTTNKRLLISESCVIRINVHHLGETWYTWHVRFLRQSMYATCTLPVGGPRTWEPFTLTQKSWTDLLLPRQSAPDLTSQPDWVAHETHLSFSPKHNHWSNALKPSICWQTGYMGSLGPYHQHVISTFNTYSWGPTHRSLTDTGGGYNLGSASLPHHTPQPSQWMVLRFPPKGPTRSQVNKLNIDL
jgi:hypothetical protein